MEDLFYFAIYLLKKILDLLENFHMVYENMVHFDKQYSNQHFLINN